MTAASAVCVVLVSSSIAPLRLLLSFALLTHHSPSIRTGLREVFHTLKLITYLHIMYFRYTYQNCQRFYANWQTVLSRQRNYLRSFGLFARRRGLFRYETCLICSNSRCFSCKLQTDFRVQQLLSILQQRCRGCCGGTRRKNIPNVPKWNKWISTQLKRDFLETPNKETTTTD